MRLQIQLAEGLLVLGDILPQNVPQGFGLLRAEEDSLVVANAHLIGAFARSSAEYELEIPNAYAHLDAVGIGLAVVGSLDKVHLGLLRRWTHGKTRLLLLCNWGGSTSATDIVRGDLDAVEELPSTPRIDLGRINGAEDLAERKLDGAAIFHYREFERPIRDSTLALRGATPGDMEVAIGHAAEGDKVALGAAGHDMTTFWTHTLSPRFS